MKTPTLVLGAVVACAVTYAVTASTYDDYAKRASQATYDYGRLVGYTLGECDTLSRIARANPDYGRQPTVVGALAACAKVERERLPGSAETVHVP